LAEESLALTTRQLSALAEVGELFERAGVDYWLFGGWAVDFYAGRITREHDDVDVAIWRTDLPRIAQMLQSAGWRHSPETDEDGGTGYERGGVRLELTYLVRDDSGVVSIPLRSGLAHWPADALTTGTAELHGVHARVIALESLAHGKARGRDEPEDAAKDATDAGVLAQLLRDRDT
jgi:hypothetical protein